VASRADGLMTALGVKGTFANTGEPVIAVTCDVPTSLRAAASKSQQEMRDVALFLDHVAPGQARPLLSPGPDPNAPPDVIAFIGDAQLRIETAQLHMPGQESTPNAIGRGQLFEGLRQRLLADSAKLAGKLPRHKGTVVYVWFQSPEGDGLSFELPPKPGGDAALIELLARCEPPPPVWPGLLPQKAPEGDIASDAASGMGVTWGELPASYRSSFTRAFGFELALGYGLTLSLSRLREELVRVVWQHDTAGADMLLVSTNSTLRSGVFYPSSGSVAHLVFEDPDPLSEFQPQHLPAVATHDPDGPGRIRWIYGPPPTSLVK
jgi:hypothetical protein